MNFPKEKYINQVETFNSFLKEIPQLMEASGETFSFFGEKLSLTRGAVSNKKNGIREWKLEELKTLAKLFNKDPAIVENQIFIITNLNSWINQYLDFHDKKKMKFLSKIDLNYPKLYTRQHYSLDVWSVEDVKKVLSHLDFEINY